MSTPLLGAPDLITLLARGYADVLLVDCRFDLVAPAAGHAAFEQGHVPGAVYAHLEHDLSGPKTGHNGRHPLPDQSAFVATLRRWGLNPGTRVLAYDASGGIFAARLWWMLAHWLGHEAVQVLDGGWAAWLAAGGAVETATPAPRAPGRFEVPAVAAQPAGSTRPTAPALVLADEVLASLDAASPPLHLLDARAPERFRGDTEPLDPVAGHIPGARNRFFQLNLQADGRFKPAATLRAEFESLLDGQAPGSLVHQCGSGVTACHNLLAMDLAGLNGSRLYAGSWSEWCSDPGRPTAR
jgi:thiosulfate/3-mercaptopyruvate sulfurtransferase